MLQLIDLARENAALRSELERVRAEAKALRLLVADEDQLLLADEMEHGADGQMFSRPT